MRKKDEKLYNVFSEYNRQFTPKIDLEKIKTAVSDENLNKSTKFSMGKIFAIASCCACLIMLIVVGGIFTFAATQKKGQAANDGICGNEDVSNGIYMQSDLTEAVGTNDKSLFDFLGESADEYHIISYCLKNGQAAYAVAEYDDGTVKTKIYVESAEGYCDIFSAYYLIKDVKTVNGLQISYSDGNNYRSLRYFTYKDKKYYINIDNYMQTDAVGADRADQLVNIIIA